MEETLGSVIAARRAELNMSQRELAKAIKVSNSTVARIERGDAITPDNNTLRAMATALRLDYNYLLALNKQIDDEPEIRMIQRAAQQMSQDDKERMMKILRLTFEDAFNNAGGDSEDIGQNSEGNVN